jgi:hypothetical protein
MMSQVPSSEFEEYAYRHYGDHACGRKNCEYNVISFFLLDPGLIIPIAFFFAVGSVEGHRIAAEFAMVMLRQPY